MPIQYTAGAVFLLCLLFSGCTSRHAAISPTVPRPLGKDIPAFSSPDGFTKKNTQFPTIEEPDGIITLRKALSLAMRNNPELAAAFWDVQVQETGILQACLLPNPEIEFEAEEFGGSGSRREFETAEISVRMSQVLELGGKRTRRVRAAALEHALSGWDFEIRRLDTLTEVTKTYIELLAAQERAVLSLETTRLSERVYSAAEARVRSGKVPPFEESRARVALAAERVKERQTARMLSVSRKRLASFWGGAEPVFESAAGSLDSIIPIPSLKNLDTVLSRNPELERWVVEMERHAALVKLEKAHRIPDVTVSGGAARFTESDESALIMSLSFPLPLFNRNQWNIRRAEQLQARAREDRRAEEIRVRERLHEAFLQLRTAYELAETLTSEIIPSAREAFESAEHGYRAGKFSSLDVLETQRTYFDAREQGIEAFAAYHIAVAEIERLTGEPLERIVGK